MLGVVRVLGLGLGLGGGGGGGGGWGGEVGLGDKTIPKTKFARCSCLMIVKILYS